MSWTADGSALSDHTSMVRVLNEGSKEVKGTNLDIAGAYGEYRTPKWYSGSDVILEFTLLDDASTPHSHMASVLGMFNGVTVLQRTNHPAGTVRADVELTGGPRQTQNHLTYALPLRRHDGVWEDTAVTTPSAGTAPSITTLGDSEIGDPVITFAGPGTAILVNAKGTSTAEWSGTGTAIMDNSLPRSVTQGGSAVDYDFDVTPGWFSFDPNTTVDLTATVSLTVDYRNKHA